MKRIVIAFFLFFTALMFVNSSFAAGIHTTKLSHFVSVHAHKHSERTSKDFIAASDIQTERSNDEYKKRLALFRLAIGKTLLANPFAGDSFLIRIDQSSDYNHHHLPVHHLSHIYPFHYFW